LLDEHPPAPSWLAAAPAGGCAVAPDWPPTGPAISGAPPAAPVSGRLPDVAAVIVTRDRPALLRQCLDAVLAQDPVPGRVIVVDNASGPDTAAVLRGYPSVAVHRLPHNTGGAGGFRAGIRAGLAVGAGWLWLMDDDGRPAGPDCLAALHGRARRTGAELVGALVVDVDAPDRLAFPLRLNGRTVFDVGSAVRHGPLPGFAHLFNGALIAAGLFNHIGLPDPRFFIRGDEVEFLYRARRSGAAIMLATDAHFLHPGSAPEIRPIMGGRFYAVMPDTAFKRGYQFRNRGYIFRAYGMWGWLAADAVRYGWFFLIGRRGDVRGLLGWAAATLQGVRGGFMRGPAPP